MTDPDTKPDPAAEAIARLPLCPECGDSLEAHDAVLLLLAAHLAQFCPATEGVLHA